MECWQNVLATKNADVLGVVLECSAQQSLRFLRNEARELWCPGAGAPKHRGNRTSLGLEIHRQSFGKYERGFEIIPQDEVFSETP